MTTVSRRSAMRGALAAAVVGGAAAAPRAQTTADGTRIRIEGGEFQPRRMALPTFLAEDPGLAETAANITAVVRSDLESSGLFAVSGGPAPASIDVQPAFADYRVSGQEALLNGAVSLESDGRIGVRFRLWDVPLTEQLSSLKFLAAPNGWRRIAHKIADDAYSKLTGEGPYFDSRIVFVEEQGPKDARRKRLAIMDSDGANLAYLTSDQDLVLTPRFSPIDQEITFISYRAGEPQVYLLNLRTERQEILGNFPGMTFAPPFLAGRQARGDEPHAGWRDRHLPDGSGHTSHAPVDAEPGYRHGAELLPRRRIDRVRVRPRLDAAALCDGRGWVEPAADQLWRRPLRDAGLVPPRRPIAFTKQFQGQFHIGVMRTDGTGERLLTQSFLDEGPTWSPNGRVIMFFRETAGEQGRPQLQFGRHYRSELAPGRYADWRIGSGVVAPHSVADREVLATQWGRSTTVWSIAMGVGCTERRDHNVTIEIVGAPGSG